MKNLIAVAVFGAALLSGCGPTLSGANERGGIISENLSSKADAFNLANEHCGKYGRVARISGQDAWQGNMTFDCVAP